MRQKAEPKKAESNAEGRRPKGHATGRTASRSSFLRSAFRSSFRPSAFFLILTVCLLPSAILSGISLVSVPQEIEIGRQAQAEMLKQAPALQDARTQVYVRSVGQRLLAAGPISPYPFTFTVADYREINAFALPGGPVWIHRGVLEKARTESEVAGVLAHEIAHITERHAADQLTKALMARMGLGLLGAMLGSGGGATTAQATAGFITSGMFLKFSRDDERRADEVGLRRLVAAGWDARGMTDLMALLREESRRDPGAVEVFFSTHPSPEERLERLQVEVARVAGRGRRDSTEFQALHRHLKTLPPARAMPKR